MVIRILFVEAVYYSSLNSILRKEAFCYACPNGVVWDGDTASNELCEVAARDTRYSEWVIWQVGDAVEWIKDHTTGVPGLTTSFSSTDKLQCPVPSMVIIPDMYYGNTACYHGAVPKSEMMSWKYLLSNKSQTWSSSVANFIVIELIWRHSYTMTAVLPK